MVDTAFTVQASSDSKGAFSFAVPAGSYVLSVSHPAFAHATSEVSLAPAQELASDLALRLGCELDDGPLGPFVKVDGMKQTSVAGVFAAGDLAAPMQSAPMALAAGQMAGLAAHRALMEDDRRRLLGD